MATPVTPGTPWVSAANSQVSTATNTTSLQVLPTGTTAMDVAYWIGGIALLAFFGWQLELHYDSGAAFLGVMLVLIALLNAQHIVALTSNMSKRLGGP